MTVRALESPQEAACELVNPRVAKHGGTRKNRKDNRRPWGVA
jgi:hypothetical protein